MNEQAYFVNTPWTWREKLKFKLFPSQPCMLPEAPAQFEDCLVINTYVYLSWKDRIRIFLTGWLRVETKTVTENVIGNNFTSSVAYPILRKE